MARSYPITLTSKVLFPGRLVRITRLDGTILRIAEAETSITVDGETFTPLPGCEISAVKHIINGEMPSMEIRFAHSVGGVLDTTELDTGFWDGALVQLYIVDRLNLTTLGDTNFTGTIQPIVLDPIGGGGSFDCRGLAAQDEAVIQTHQPMCLKDLYGTLCTVDPAAFTHTGTVGSIVDRFTITVAGLASPPADNYFNGGFGTSASGFAFEIGDWTQSTLRLKLFLPLCASRFTVGEALSLRAGCDKTDGANGCAKFSNLINFGGKNHFLGINSIVGV